MTNFELMYRDLAHGPTPNYNISCSGNQASVHGMWDGHPHQVRCTMVPRRPNSTRSFNGDIIYAHIKNVYYWAVDEVAWSGAWPKSEHI